jgi:hypothetical protein
VTHTLVRGVIRRSYAITTMTQGLRDLKRLYWNLRRFRTGLRKDQTPYDLLGLKVPDLSFREFLTRTPEELRQKLSAWGDTP